MAILLDKSTRLLVPGPDRPRGHVPREAGRGLRHHRRRRRHARQGRDDARRLAGVRHRATRRCASTGANASVIFVPPAFAADAIMEAADAGMPLVVCITEGIPTLDMMRALTFLKDTPTRLIGPNCPGVISPGKSKAGIIPGHICREGTRRHRLEERHADLRGHPSAHRPGPRPVHRASASAATRSSARSFIDVLQLFSQDDPDTEAVIMIGEIGGSAEQEAAACIKATLQEARRRLHRRARRRRPAAAWATPAPSSPAARGTADEKMQALFASGVTGGEEPCRDGRRAEEAARR